MNIGHIGHGQLYIGDVLVGEVIEFNASSIESNEEHNEEYKGFEIKCEGTIQLEASPGLKKMIKQAKEFQMLDIKRKIYAAHKKLFNKPQVNKKGKVLKYWDNKRFYQ